MSITIGDTCESFFVILLKIMFVVLQNINYAKFNFLFSWKMYKFVK